MIHELLQFLDINDDTIQSGHHLWEILAPRAEDVLDKFYRRVRLSKIRPELTDATVRQLKRKQEAHWAALFGSRFGDDYIDSVHRIGIRHRDIGLDLAWYAAAYLALKLEFGNVIIQSDLPAQTKGHLIWTLDKFVAFDMALALSTYDAAILD
jgi:Protoglobin